VKETETKEYFSGINLKFGHRDVFNCVSQRGLTSLLYHAQWKKKQIFIDKGTEVKKNSQYSRASKALSRNYEKENLTKNGILQPYYVR
jgi:hypothetical protein